MSTCSAASHSFLKTKLRDCCANHALCAVADSGFIPTRVLEMADATMIRLIRGSNVTGRYATLSHCWGRAQMARLLASNQADLERGIALATLPATFQQAIGVTRFLEIPYLWIDSLCIVQDSAADWEVESAAMADVYGHALVNIAAASSTDASGGLFFDRDPAVVQPFTAYTPGSGTLAKGWYTWEDNSRRYRIGEEPLHRRGWVLQERASLFSHYPLYQLRDRLALPAGCRQRVYPDVYPTRRYGEISWADARLLRHTHHDGRDAAGRRYNAREDG